MLFQKGHRISSNTVFSTRKKERLQYQIQHGISTVYRKIILRKYWVTKEKKIPPHLKTKLMSLHLSGSGVSRTLSLVVYSSAV